MIGLSPVFYSVLFMIIVIDLKAKLMKIILIPILMFLSIQSYAVEFYQCIDAKGQPHYSNLPADSFDSNCKQKSDRYDYLLKQDYSNLSAGFNKYQSEQDQSDNKFSIGGLELMIPHKDMFDSEVAAEELLETTSKRNDPITNLFRDGREALEPVNSNKKQLPNQIEAP
jgi:hypothetical protein